MDENGSSELGQRLTNASQTQCEIIELQINLLAQQH